MTVFSVTSGMRTSLQSHSTNKQAGAPCAARCVVLCRSPWVREIALFRLFARSRGFIGATRLATRGARGRPPPCLLLRLAGPGACSPSPHTGSRRVGLSISALRPAATPHPGALGHAGTAHHAAHAFHSGTFSRVSPRASQAPPGQNHARGICLMRHARSLGWRSWDGVHGSEGRRDN